MAINDAGYVWTGQPSRIEFGILQYIGKGVSLLLQGQIVKDWSNGSVIRGWLGELMERGLREQDYSKIPSYVEDNGEVDWVLDDAINR